MNIQEVYRPILTHFRRKRLRIFYDYFSDISQSTTLLDIGGGLFFWKLAQKEGYPLPKITILNVYPHEGSPLPENVKWVVGDGKKIPFEDGSFDIAFCNSVIEHLYTWNAQLELANEIQRVADSHFIQTPSKAFFFEPHLLTPFIHWLPKEAQKPLLRNFTGWGIITRPSPEECETMLNELRLLTQEEMRQLFPESSIKTERALGWEKSIIALKK